MTATSAATAGAETLTRTLRRVHRAASDLRRGVPVLLEGANPLLLLSAETAGAESLAEFTSLGIAPPVVLFAPVRGAAVLRRAAEGDAAVIAAVLPEALAHPDALRGLADPTAKQPITAGMTPVEPPPGAAAAIALAKLGRLLPAVLAVTPVSVASLADRALISISPDDVLACPAMEGAGLRIVASAPVPLADAPNSRVVAFRAEGSAIEHLAIVIGRPETADAPLVRIHSECFTGDLLGSMRCDCGEQLRGAIHRIAAYGFIASLALRAYWSFAGNEFASWRVLFPYLTVEGRRGMRGTFLYYTFIRREPPREVGHNALAGVTYSLVVLVMFIEVLTGLALLSMIKGGLWSTAFGWVFLLLSPPITRLIHHMGMWLLLGFAVHHVYSAVLMDVEERNGLLASIFSGYKFKRI